ncbi:hypothetical protein [Sphingomonas sp. BAUL-RG-20F-R05-02]|uniref:hypothetical protein n=1 Tax=Sphingomonas sp. BAUL-RG-20F-R05-02 TaxID=2914830 RepID=UPI001F5AB2CF|nr:hypothetical protein [Sphingomonas sp. BAUL-RG-20F-R05-02]
MAISDPFAQELLNTMDAIAAILELRSPDRLGELSALRYKVMRALTGYLNFLEKSCARMKGGTEAEKLLGKAIEAAVLELRMLVNSHVTRWTPLTISSDMPSYEKASRHLQTKMRNIVAQTIPPAFLIGPT